MRSPALTLLAALTQGVGAGILASGRDCRETHTIVTCPAALVRCYKPSAPTLSILCCSHAYGAGFALGRHFMGLNGRLSPLVASARAGTAQSAAAMGHIEAWRRKSSGRWIEPKP